MKDVGLIISDSTIFCLIRSRSGITSSPAAIDTSGCCQKHLLEPENFSNPSDMLLSDKAYASFDENSMHVLNTDTKD